MGEVAVGPLPSAAAELPVRPSPEMPGRSAPPVWYVSEASVVAYCHV